MITELSSMIKMLDNAGIEYEVNTYGDVTDVITDDDIRIVFKENALIDIINYRYKD